MNIYMCSPFKIIVINCSYVHVQAKDDGNVADAAYHELKLVPGVNLPPINRIKEERKKQNAIIPIYELDKVCVKIDTCR